MIIKGIIKNIDFSSNTCNVRMPYFEAAGDGEVVGPATFSILPGAVNGYNAGDVVMIAFEDGHMETPVVIGKLFVDVDAEKDCKISLTCGSIKALNSAELPVNTKIVAGTEAKVQSVNKDLSTFDTLAALIQEIHRLREEVNILKTIKSTTTICRNATTNIYGNAFEHFGSDVSGNDIVIKYDFGYNTYLNGVPTWHEDWSSNLPEDILKSYMLQMTGSDLIPELTNSNDTNKLTFSNVLQFIDGNIYYIQIKFYPSTSTYTLTLKNVKAVDTSIPESSETTTETPEDPDTENTDTDGEDSDDTGAEDTGDNGSTVDPGIHIKPGIKDILIENP